MTDEKTRNGNVARCRSRFRFLRSLLLVVGLIPAAARAGAIEGRVVDATGGLLPGVTVEIANGDHHVTKVAVTGVDGHYEMKDLSAGSYQLSFKLINFATSTRPVRMTEDQTAVVDVRLPLASNAEIVVTGKRTFNNLADLDEPLNGLVGIADSATEGVVTAQQIEERPVSRAGEILETVPGVIISQHSGEGKANQYYLRGFDLDHGTDVAITVAGVPVNFPTHAHGQGYSDTNFLIPELISGVQYKKGPYYAEEGDFSAAGAVNINYANTLDHPIAMLGAGDLGYERILFADSPKLGAGHFLYAIEGVHNDGPWVHPDDYRRLNGVLRYSAGNERDGFSVTAMGYGGRWNSTDQVPDRAIEDGLISRFGAIDPTDGGQSRRYTANAEWQRTRENSLTKVDAYGIVYNLNLFSNFTYFLDDPIHGDQFEQQDRRVVTGLKVRHQWLARLGGFDVENIVGLDERNDNIGSVALFHTEDRQVLSTTSSDRVVQTSGALYAQSTINWSSKLRTVVGLREDDYQFHVRSDDSENSGTAHATMTSPKMTAIAGPWRNTELYANAGYGFHSNDARGTTLTEDPATHDPAEKVTPLVRAKGAEVGVRSTAIPGLQSTLSLWGLDLASELVFEGDTGTTEASRPSRRQGIEWANYYSLAHGITIDADYTQSHARFTDFDPGGEHIPGSPAKVISAGVAFVPDPRFTMAIRYRYFGPRPLVEDDSVRSRKSDTYSARAGYKLPGGYRFDLDLFNILNAKVSDIDYYYASRLPGEPADGVNDIHTHPIEPRSFRVAVGKTF